MAWGDLFKPVPYTKDKESGLVTFPIVGTDPSKNIDRAVDMILEIAEDKHLVIPDKANLFYEEQLAYQGELNRKRINKKAPILLSEFNPEKSLEEVTSDSLGSIEQDDRFIGIGWENPFDETAGMITFDDIIRGWRLRDYIARNAKDGEEEPKDQVYKDIYLMLKDSVSLYAPNQQRIIVGDQAIVKVPSFTKQPVRKGSFEENIYPIEMYGITSAPLDDTVLIDPNFNLRSYRIGIVHGGKCGRIYDYLKFGRILGRENGGRGLGGDSYEREFIRKDESKRSVSYKSEILWDHHCALALLSLEEFYRDSKKERIVNPLFSKNSVFNPMDPRVTEFHKALHEKCYYMKTGGDKDPKILPLSRGQISILSCAYVGKLNSS